MSTLTTAAEIAARRDARGMADPLNRLRAYNARHAADAVTQVRAPVPAPGPCPWQFHVISRAWADGRATLTLEGWRYGDARLSERATVRASEPCAVVTVESDGRYVESDAASELVTAHCQPYHVPVWHGRGWTVEIASGYSLWRVTA